MIPALRRWKQEDLCEFKTSLVYKFQDRQGYTEKSGLRKQTKNDVKCICRT